MVPLALKSGDLFNGERPGRAGEASPAARRRGVDGANLNAPFRRSILSLFSVTRCSARASVYLFVDFHCLKMGSIMLKTLIGAGSAVVSLAWLSPPKPDPASNPTGRHERRRRLGRRIRPSQFERDQPFSIPDAWTIGLGYPNVVFSTDLGAPASIPIRLHGIGSDYTFPLRRPRYDKLPARHSSRRRTPRSRRSISSSP